jgi:hypothetical protein
MKIETKFDKGQLVDFQWRNSDGTRSGKLQRGEILAVSIYSDESETSEVYLIRSRTCGVIEAYDHELTPVPT